MRLGSTRQDCSPGLQPWGIHLSSVFFWLVWMLCCCLAFHLTAYELLFVPTFFILGYWTSKSMPQLALKISCVMVTYAFGLNHLKHKPSIESDVAVLHVLGNYNHCTSQLGLRGKGSFSSCLWFSLMSVLLNRMGVHVHSEILNGTQSCKSLKHGHSPLCIQFSPGHL